MDDAFYEIKYDAYYFDPTIGRNYVSAALGVITVSGFFGLNSERPEIASVDEISTLAIYDYPFAIVWQLTNALGQINIQYRDGRTTIFPAIANALNPGGQINPPNGIGDSYDPDIEGFTLFLGNSGDQLILYDDLNVTVDFAYWEGYVAGWDVAATHTTIRRNTTIDTDTVSDWEDSTTIGDPGSGIYIVIIPEFTTTIIGLVFLSIGILSLVGLSYRKKK